MKVSLESRRVRKSECIVVLLPPGRSKTTTILGISIPAISIPPTLGQYTRVREGTQEFCAFSLGEEKDLRAESFRNLGGMIAAWMKSHEVKQVALLWNRTAGQGNDLVALCEGFQLGDFSFNKHQTKKSSVPKLEVTILRSKVSAEEKRSVRNAIAMCDGTNFARSIAHEPPNEITPVTLAQRAKALATQCGLKCTIIDDKQMAKLKMGALLAVGKGSAAGPRLVALEYKGSRSGPPVVVIGKSITFDTGGYSLKNTEGIVGMKYDKCGGAAVMGIMQAVSKLKPRTSVVGILSAAENMIAPHAYRPDDIIKSLSGQTVEIVSTDAEGRLVLADALTYAQKTYKPKAMIDLATLTGGIIVALGRFAAGLFCEDDALRDALVESGRRTHERVWPMPLWSDYDELIKSQDADFKNSGGRYAHPVIGGIFLKKFVDAKVPWAHLDIAGTATVDENKSYCPKGATGFGVRLVCDYLMNL